MKITLGLACVALGIGVGVGWFPLWPAHDPVDTWRGPVMACFFFQSLRWLG